MAAFGSAMAGLHGVEVDLVRHRRAQLGEEPLSELIRLVDELSDADLVSTVLLLTIAGHVTVATQLGNGLLALFSTPAELERLRSGEVAIVTVQTGANKTLPWAPWGRPRSVATFWRPGYAVPGRGTGGMWDTHGGRPTGLPIGVRLFLRVAVRRPAS
jgi:hypothetical protein